MVEKNEKPKNEKTLKHVNNAKMKREIKGTTATNPKILKSPMHIFHKEKHMIEKNEKPGNSKNMKNGNMENGKVDKWKTGKSLNSKISQPSIS